jgi:predicted transglutaminase-like cysteine proteinase
LKTERFDNLIEKVRTPVKVKHCHLIDIGSSKAFFSIVVIAVTILGIVYIIDNQRETISQYKDNDLKYRYIKMQEQASEEDIYRLETKFEHSN